MMSKEVDKNRGQIQFFAMDDLVPQDHMLRLVDKAIDWSFIYDLVEDKYSQTTGRPSMDPVTLIKIPLIQYLYGIPSMRKTIKEIEVNVAYRWFLGLDLRGPVPHFTTFGKNYTRRFKDSDLFEQIFARILEQCFKFHLIDTSIVFVDATHIKACANSKKGRKKMVRQEALFYKESLRQEIDSDREEHGKKPLKDKDDDHPGGAGGGGKEIKTSDVDPDSGWFHKGEHKSVFAYSAQTACDTNGWILDYTIHPGNLNDGRTFHSLYEKIKRFGPRMIVADAGYRTPAIAKLLLDDGIQPLLPYRRPMTRKGFFKRSDYVYDEKYDWYICPNHCTLQYTTTNRDGYREYRSCAEDCECCPCSSRCTESKDHIKLVTHHVWQDYMEQVEDIRYTLGNYEIYKHRKECIERLFGTAKEYHGMRYTRMIGKARMQMKVGLTYTCMNLKKLVSMLQKRGGLEAIHV
ncbi:IS1182 family transposase [Extibacter muris]|uniref:IS1182 family transposase n=2 Tax=Extibacter muris TaxID=1796622 RepID=UPI001D0692F3|nr:IS1182 family transposase [Extibacter muris]MCB6203994.1 IS1182 family transposase [Extibacter muris]